MTFFLKILGMFLGYLVFLYISRTYGSKGMGIYNLTLNTLTIIAMISSMGFNISVLRYVGQYNSSESRYKLKHFYRQAIELIVPISLIFSLLLFFFADMISIHAFNNIEYSNALKIASFTIPFLSLHNVNVEFIRGINNLKLSEYLNSISRPIINLSLLIVLNFTFFNFLLPIMTLATAIIFSSVISALFVIAYLKKLPSEKNKSFSKKELLSISLPMLTTIIATLLIENISLLTIEFFHTTEDVGVYSLVYKLASLISLSLLVINNIYAAQFSNLYWNNQKKILQKTILTATKLTFWVSILTAIFFLLFSKQILGFFGADFEAGKSDLFLLILAHLAATIGGPVVSILNMSNHHKTLRNIFCAALFIDMIAHILLVPKHGTSGAAVATIITTCILHFGAAFVIKTKMNITTYYIPLFSDLKRFKLKH